MESVIVGREAEIHDLERAYAARELSVVLVKGRRRVGKTFLVNHVFKGRFSFKFTGTHKAAMKKQLAKFSEALFEYGYRGKGEIRTWADAFASLRHHIDSFDDSKRVVVFLDELPWMDTKKSGFLFEFNYFLNDYASAKDNLMLILCGSSSSWIDKKFTKSKGGLYNRHTDLVSLQPFNLFETERYLVGKGFEWPRYEIVMMYMALGGIPYYLNKLDPALTPSENIDALFFRPGAKLEGEFPQLYETLFTKGAVSAKIMRLLSKEKAGLPREEIAKRSGLSDGGALSEALEGIVSSGFARIKTSYLGRKKRRLYVLSDYFTLFYFHFIQENAGKDEHFWRNSYNESSRRAWLGFSFERVVSDHLFAIKGSLGISGILSEDYSYRAEAKDGKDGAQIDLVIDRKDKVATLCEIKYLSQEFTVDKDYRDNLENKKERYREDLGARKSIQLVFVSTFGLKRSLYGDVFSKAITIDDLFTKHN